VAHFWGKLPHELDGLTLRQYRRLELFAAEAIKALDVPATREEVN